MELIPVSKAGEYIEVHPATLAEHKQLGWVECEKREPEPEAPTEHSSTGKAVKLSVEELRTVLTEAGVDFDPKAKKADLQALFDALPAAGETQQPEPEAPTE